MENTMANESEKKKPLTYYSGRPTQAVMGRTQGGKPQIAIGFDLLNSEGEPNGLQMIWYGVFHDGAREHTVKALRACGWQSLDLHDCIEIKNGFGQDVKLACEKVIKTIDGKEVEIEKIRWVNELGLGAAVKDKMSEVEIDDFAEQLHLELQGDTMSAGVPDKEIPF
jgi:hypothetical protein